MADRDVEEDVAEANATFYRCFETGDLDGMQDMWLEDSESLCVHPGARPVRGASAISRSWALIMANTPYIQFFLTDVEVSVRGDVATVTCTENVLTAGEVADAAFTGAQAVATNVFWRTPQGWRLWVHHASPVLSGQHHDDD